MKLSTKAPLALADSTCCTRNNQAKDYGFHQADCTGRPGYQAAKAKRKARNKAARTARKITRRAA
jgi:hypothetical protein